MSSNNLKGSFPSTLAVRDPFPVRSKVKVITLPTSYGGNLGGVRTLAP
jgi:hypothetical protein